jgi:hypothetical protein
MTWQETICAARWPGYAVTGSGTIAVVFRCCARIELVTTPMVARAIRTEDCGAHNCLRRVGPGYHAAIVLTKPSTAADAGCWERDK